VKRMGDIRNEHKIFVGKPEGKIPSGRHWGRWEDNIRLDHKLGVRMWIGFC